MITGLREFRNTLSRHISFIQRGQIVIVTDRDKPIASLVSVDKLRELAKKAEDTSIIMQLKEVQADENKEFIKGKNQFIEEIRHYLKQCEDNKGKIPESVVKKLQAILSTTIDLISDDGTFEDQRILSFMRIKSRDPMSRVLDFDYYNIHSGFLESVKNEVKHSIEDISFSTGKSLKTNKEIKVLADMIENAVTRDKNDSDDTISEYHSVLVRMTKDKNFYTSRIYTIMPHWYRNSKNYDHFISLDSPLARKMYGKKVGYKFTNLNIEYEILSIS